MKTIKEIVEAFGLNEEEANEFYNASSYIQSVIMTYDSKLQRAVDYLLKVAEDKESLKRFLENN